MTKRENGSQEHGSDRDNSSCGVGFDDAPLAVFTPEACGDDSGVGPDALWGCLWKVGKSR